MYRVYICDIDGYVPMRLSIVVSPFSTLSRVINCIAAVVTNHHWLNKTYSQVQTRHEIRKRKFADGDVYKSILLRGWNSHI